MFGRRDGLDLKVPLCSRVSVTYLIRCLFRKLGMR